jgi:hypothetical protein
MSVAKNDKTIDMSEIESEKVNIGSIVNSYIMRILQGESGWYNANFKTDRQMKAALEILKKSKSVKDVFNK